MVLSLTMSMRVFRIVLIGAERALGLRIESSPCLETGLSSMMVNEYFVQYGFVCFEVM